MGAGRPIDWVRLVGFEFLYWYIWAALTPFILWFAKKFRLERGNLWRGALPLLAAGLLIAPIQAALETAIAFTIEFTRKGMTEDLLRRWNVLGQGILVESFSNIIIYLLILSGHYAYDYYRKYRDREMRSLELEGRLTQAELHNLKAQLQPHFLFNTLHTISVLMMRDTAAANRMLIRLSDLLRLSLDNVRSQEVSLKEELDFLAGYLEIEQTRFRDRLNVCLKIEPTTINARVPNLILQPLVENSIKHGIAKMPRGGTIEICSALVNGDLMLEVRDDGPGFPKTDGEALTEGVGLGNTRARLLQLYGTRHKFELRNKPGGGLLVTLVIPFEKYEARG